MGVTAITAHAGGQHHLSCGGSVLTLPPAQPPPCPSPPACSHLNCLLGPGHWRLMFPGACWCLSLLAPGEASPVTSSLTWQPPSLTLHSTWPAPAPFLHACMSTGLGAPWAANPQSGFWAH